MVGVSELADIYEVLGRVADHLGDISNSLRVIARRDLQARGDEDGGQHDHNYDLTTGLCIDCGSPYPFLGGGGDDNDSTTTDDNDAASEQEQPHFYTVASLDIDPSGGTCAVCGNGPGHDDHYRTGRGTVPLAVEQG